MWEGSLSTTVSLPGSVTFANSPARAHGSTVGTRWEKVYIRGPQKKGQETEEFLCAYPLGIHKQLFLKIMIWATGGECHYSEFFMKSELQRIFTPVENWKARGGFGSELKWLADTGAKLVPTAFS